ncbi:MAG: hypothetical protein Q4D16_13500 [Eubacteriales bacterium]|nr:hypothetical protein [Eubacteriales bacterium]
MARRRREVKMTAAEITNEMANIDVEINALTTQIKELKANRKKLVKDYAIAQAQEAEAAKAKEMEELVQLIQEKGLTVEQIKELVQ